MHLAMRYISKNRFGVFHYRRPIPPALQPVLGRTELKCTLGTSSATEARTAWPRANAWAEKVLSDARRIAAGGASKVMQRHILEAADARPAWSPAEHEAGDAVPLPMLIEEGNQDWRQARIEEMAAAAGIKPDSAAWDAFEKAAHTTLDQAARARAYAVAGLAQPADIERQIEAAKAITVSEAVAAWIERRAKRIGKKGEAEAKRAAKQFGDDRDIRAVQKIDAVLFRDQMIAEGRSVQTVKKYLMYLRGAFAEYAEAVTPEPANPFAGLKFVEIEAPAEARRAFSERNIADFFALPCFRKPEGGADGAALFWIPLIALTTGARQNEIVQLTADDVVEEGGVTFIDINPGRGDEKKRIKNRDSIRRVPVPATLTRLGFLQYAASKAGRLFDLQADTHGNLAGLFSKKINREIDKIDNDPALTFHSFRHTFIQRATAVGIRPDYLKAIIGHEDRSTTNRSYGQRRGLSLATLKKEIDKVKWQIDAKALEKAASITIRKEMNKKK